MSRLCRCLVSFEGSRRPPGEHCRVYTLRSALVAHGRLFPGESSPGTGPPNTRATLTTNRGTFQGTPGKSFSFWTLRAYLPLADGRSPSVTHFRGSRLRQLASPDLVEVLPRQWRNGLGTLS